MDSLKMTTHGWMNIELVVDGVEVKKTIDLITFYNDAVNAGRDAADSKDWSKCHKDRAEFFTQELGATFSPTDAYVFFDLLHAKVMDLKKKDPSNGNAEPPNSTGSPTGQETMRRG